MWRQWVVPGTGLEPVWPLRAADFKSAASADFAIRARGDYGCGEAGDRSGSRRRCRHLPAAGTREEACSPHSIKGMPARVDLFTDAAPDRGVPSTASAKIAHQCAQAPADVRSRRCRSPPMTMKPVRTSIPRRVRRPGIRDHRPEQAPGRPSMNCPPGVMTAQTLAPGYWLEPPPQADRDRSRIDRRGDRLAAGLAGALRPTETCERFPRIVERDGRLLDATRGARGAAGRAAARQAAPATPDSHAAVRRPRSRRCRRAVRRAGSLARDGTVATGGGANRSRTGLDGFAIRCITALLSRRGIMRNKTKGSRGFPLLRANLERETRLELATSTLARLRSTN